MSHNIHEAINIHDAGLGTVRASHMYPPQSVPAQPPLGASNFVDGSGPIFSMYLDMATEEDKKMAENWKADADGILIFTGLFSAAVASLISVSIQDIRQNPQDTSNFYLANIYETLADPSRPNTSLPASPPSFSPPNYAVWVNALWFLSLVISLTCALLATLLQQWTRRYLKANQSRYSPHKRARIRAFLSEGVEKLLLPWTVETLPTLLHISLFLFFAGLVVFLWDVNLTIFKLESSWVGVCMALYGCITVIPILRHDSPYVTPLSLPAWHIVTGISFLTSRALQKLASVDYFSSETYSRFEDLADRYGKWLVQGMQKTIEETALKSPSEIDTRAFLWTLDSLDEDHELEFFFSGLPGFRSSKVVNDPVPSLTKERKYGLFIALLGLLSRTFSSDLLPKLVKSRRAIICTKALALADIPDAYPWILRRITYGDRDEGLCTAEFGCILRGWAEGLGGNQRAEMVVVQATLFAIVAKAQRRNDSWFLLASSELDIPEAVLRDYAAHGDSLSLTVLIHLVRQQFSHYAEMSWPKITFSEVLLAASKSIVQDTLAELQHEFCALWNQIVRKVQNDNNRRMAFHVLGPIRNIYIAFHQGTDSAPTQFSASTGDWDIVLWETSSYPLCNIPGYHPESTPPAPHVHGLGVSPTPTIARAIVPDSTALIPVPLIATPDVTSLFLPPPLRVDENPADVPLLEKNSFISASFHPTHQTATRMESLCSPGASPDPVGAGATRDIDISPPPRTMCLFTLGPSGSTPLPRSPSPTISPPDAVTIEHTTDNRTSSLGVSLSPSPTQVLDNILPTGLPLSSASPVTETEHASSLPVPHSLLLAPGAPGPAHPRLSFAPHIGAAAMGEGSSTTTALCKDEDTLQPSSTIRENIMAGPNLPPLYSPPTSTDITLR